MGIIEENICNTYFFIIGKKKIRKGLSYPLINKYKSYPVEKIRFLLALNENIASCNIMSSYVCTQKNNMVEKGLVSIFLIK